MFVFYSAYIFSVLFIVSFGYYIWKNRYVLYYSNTIPLPNLSFPLECLKVLIEKKKYTLFDLEDLCHKYPQGIKIWLGLDLNISVTSPQHIEQIFTQVVNKDVVHSYSKDFLKESIMIAPVSLWRQKRKIISPSFNSNLVNSFFNIFKQYADSLATKLEAKCDIEFDVYNDIWLNAIDLSCETIAGIDPESINTRKQLSKIFEMFGKSVQTRIHNPLLQPDLSWNLCNLKKAIKINYKEACDIVQEMVTQNRSTDNVPNNLFLKNILKNMSNEDSINMETILMFWASSETNALVLAGVLVFLGLFPDVQQKLFEEQLEIFKDTNQNFSLEHLSQMSYLERVIKETMRLLPPVPILLRTIEKTYFCDSFTLPKNCQVFVPVNVVHRHPEVWLNPLKFDPDRFLPEEELKRPKGSFIPFSYGPRGCIAQKYAMLSMKISLSVFIRKLQVLKCVDYQKVDDVKLSFALVGKPIKGYKVVLKQRC